MTHEKVSRDLLRKYDRPGPRYTSYPTVPEWSSDFGNDQYIQALQRASQTDDPLSLYFHIPFCKARCYYCGCTTVITSSSERVDNYIELLNREMDLVKEHLGQRKNAIHLHWGGGTPTYLNVSQMEKLFGHITDHFSMMDDSELAIEVDPRVTSEDHLRALRGLGFNRISMGVQDLTPEVQSAIGRDQTYEETKVLFDLSRKLGFDGINIDLIFGLPNQTVANFAKTIDEVTKMGVDRVAVYSFAYLPDFKAHQKKILPETLPNTTEKYDLFATAVEKFHEAGYIQIGMDHFARPDDELSLSLKKGQLYRTFMGYTPRFASDAIGIGMSSISEIAGAFLQNISKIDSYGRVITDGQLAVLRGCELSTDDQIRQDVIVNLMCNFKLDYDQIDEKFGIDSREYFSVEKSELNQFIDDGLLESGDDGITVLPRGQIFVRNIAMLFDAYLRAKGEEGSSIFSRTV